jgi:carboxylesterase type B
MSYFFLNTIITWVLLTLAACGQEPLPVNVTTTEGSLKGRHDPSLDINIFKSIPFALPPLGEHSFAPTQLPLNYSVEYDASGFIQKACMQPMFEPVFIKKKNYMGEDCLYLDIFTPANKSSDPDGYPVLVWIHGGGMFMGSKEDFNISSFAMNGVVAVAINYRLGPWGFLRVSRDIPGTYGFLDQVQALKWIKENIASFGGNPNLVTIQGQSAGGRSVISHLISPLSQGLFHRAHIMSGPIHHLPSQAEANATAVAFSTLLGCEPYNSSCIRMAGSEQVLQTEYLFINMCYCSVTTCGLEYYAYQLDKGGTLCGLNIEAGNDDVPEPTDAFLHGKVNSVPIMVGSAWNEGINDSNMQYNPLLRNAGMFYLINQIGLTENLYKQFLNQIVDHKGYEGDVLSNVELLSDQAKELYKMYPYNVTDEGFNDMYPYGYNGYKQGGQPLDATYVYFAMYNDKVYLCPTIAFMRDLQAALGSTSPTIYMYRFAQFNSSVFQTVYEEEYQSDPKNAVQDHFFSYNLYSSHGWDIPLWHSDKFPLGLIPNFTDSETVLMERMFGYMLNFIHTGDPNLGPKNSSLIMPWQPFSPYLNNMLYLSEPEINPAQVENPRGQFCTYWEKVKYEY